MPHDKNGVKLKAGDKVIVHCVIKEVTSEGGDYCNLQLATVEPLFPANYPTTISLNAKQVVYDTDQTAPHVEVALDKARRETPQEK